jgi:hypothetical protein
MKTFDAKEREREREREEKKFLAIFSVNKILT